jgi:VIT1/CCC1 family predicted Fe2+/Mn2+ transporter
LALARIARARTRIERGSRVRELVFGLQDALLATVGLLAGVDGATQQNSKVVIFAGLSHLVAGSVSMGAGEYLSSSAQRRVVAAATREAREIGEAEPYVAQEGVLEALQGEGLDRTTAYRVVALLSRSRGALATMFQATTLGVGVGDDEGGRRDSLLGAAVMAGSFAVGAILPVVPYFVWHGAIALVLSIGIACVAIFAVGAAIGRLSADNPLRAALEFSAIALGAGGIGYAAGLVISAIGGGQGVTAGG